MKTSLKLIALLIAAGYPVVALADSFGIRVPASFTPEYVLSAFVAVLFGLMLFSDYSRRRQSIDLAAAPVIVPPASAFVKQVSAKSECLAA